MGTRCENVAQQRVTGSKGDRGNLCGCGSFNPCASTASERQHKHQYRFRVRYFRALRRHSGDALSPIAFTPNSHYPAEGVLSAHWRSIYINYHFLLLLFLFQRGIELLISCSLDSVSAKPDIIRLVVVRIFMEIASSFSTSGCHE